MKNSIWWDITPCNLFKINGFFGGTVASIFRVEELNKKFSTKMEATSSSETSTDFQRTKWHYILEDTNLRNHRHENLKSYWCWT
jgi:hypothetical protein